MLQDPVLHVAGDGLEEIWRANQTVPTSTNTCIHTLIAAQADKYPHKVAVHAWDGDFTYDQLTRLSNRLANALRHHGVGPNHVVPLLFEKSRWTAVSALAVLKAGGAFALIDFGQPVSRLQSIIDQCRAKVVCTSARSQQLLPTMTAHTLIISQETLPRYADETSSGLPRPDASSPMYVCFTSGSTGKPKGIIISHASYCSTLKYQAPVLGLTEESRTFDFASYSFDVAVHNVMTTLAVGGCLCVPSEQQRMESLNETMREMKANSVNLTSSVAQLLRPELVPDLKSLILLGESVSQKDLERLWGQLTITNAYGPAECTPISTVNVAALSPAAGTGIGRGVGALTWIVDAEDDQKLAPIGSVGELLLEGPGLADGYLHNQEATAAAFINDPEWLLRGSGSVPGRRGRLYKTGDLVKYNQDGSLSFVGRKDTQVKIRGQRIELGEVEYHVQDLMPPKSKCVADVIKPGGQRDNALLAAFLTCEESSDVVSWSRVAELSEGMALIRMPPEFDEALSRRLPRAMIPAVYLLIDAIPLNVNGKTDRKRLHELGAGLTPKQLASLQAASETKRQPETERQRRLRNVWASVIGLPADNIGLDDSFFRLGGDSIAVMKVVAECRKAGWTLAVSDVFRHPILADQASVLSSDGGATSQPIPPFSLLGGTLKVAEIQNELSSLCDGVKASQVVDAYPCTPLQEGMISLSSKHSSETGNYVMQSVLELSHDVDVDDFKRAWDVAVSSTPILRTRIVQYGQNGLVQVVCTEGVSWMHGEDLEKYLEEDRTAEMGPGNRLIRLALISSTPGKPRWFVLTLHHALFDGWSLPLLLERVLSAYNGDADIVQDDASFKAFVARSLESNSDEAASYWTSISRDSDVTLFPTLPSTITQVDPRSSLETKFTSTTQPDITISTMLRAALALLTVQYTGSSDIVFGSVVSGRTVAISGIETLIGPTIATVPVRINVNKAEIIQDYLQGIQRQATEMMPYEQTGLQKIAKFNNDTRSLCNFQTLLVVQPEEDVMNGQNALGTWQTEFISQNQQMTQTYALTLECVLSGDEVKVQATFDERVINAWTMERMLKQLGVLLHRLTAALPGQTIEHIIAASDQDMAVMWQWNQHVPETVHECIHDMIGKYAVYRPDSPAVHAWDGQLTHQELDLITSKVAGLLRDLGVGPEVVVPLCFEKSMWTIVAMLGVLKAGGAFVLLDPGHPEQRLQSICQQTRASIAVASSNYRLRLSKFVMNTLVLDETILQQSPSAVSETTKPSPRNAAYIIFTSGSTGQPKGCAIEHYSYCSAAINHGSVMNLSHETRSLQFGSYQFAGAIMEILMTLIYGGCVCVPSEEQRASHQLASVICEMNANWAFLTATVLAGLQPEDVPSLKTVCAGGEPIRSTQLAQWSPKVHLRQTYGSAETSAVVSSAWLSGATSTTGDVGKPTTGRYWLVDPENINRLVPIGAPGEIIIESPAIAREYLGDADKSAKAFVSPPSWRAAFGPLDPSARFFRTGDLGSFKTDGSLSLMGRKDTQVKLRGQRIEVEEIECQAKLATPDIKTFVVVLSTLKNSEAGPQLVGFFTSTRGQVDEDADSLYDDHVVGIIRSVQTKLESVLPHYMIPALMIPLSTQPLTASGKTDRRRLKDMASQLSHEQVSKAKTAISGDKRPVTTPNEIHLRDLWAEVLRLDPESIGLGDSFFRLGGDSVSALKLVGMARKAGLSLSVADIFQHPVLEAQARLDMEAVEDGTAIEPFSLIETEANNMANIHRQLANMCSVEADRIEDAYPCTPLQEGLMSLTAKRSGDYIMQAVLELAEDVRVGDFKAAWEKAIESTTVFRTRIVQHESGGLLQVVLQAGGIEWCSETGSLEKYLRRDKKVPMGLGSSLSRFGLVKDNTEKKQHFVWTIHHALYDGWSLPRMMRRVSDIYNGLPISSPPSFNAFIQYSQTRKAANTDMEFWSSYLQGGEFALFPALPATVTEPEADDKLEMDFSFNAKSQFTTAAVIRAALAILISQYSGCDDVVFGAVVSGRNAPVAGIEDIIGPTMATVPVRIQAPKHHDVISYLDTVQKQAAAMIPHEQTGLQQIAKICEASRNACAFQTLLVVHTEGDDSLNDKCSLGQWKETDDSQGFTTYALTLEFFLGKNNHRLLASFDSSVMDKWTLEKFLHQLTTIMECLNDTCDTSQSIGDLQTRALSKEDKHVLWQWNRDMPQTVQKCLHHLISEQVTSRPDAPAVCAWDGELSYQELDELSSKLAYHLKELGVSPRAVGSEMIVPLCFEKSMWTVVAMYAVLKAGGAFVLLEPSLPEQRIRNICQQAKARIALTSTMCQNRLLDIVPETVVLSSQLVASINSPKRFAASPSPSNAAYVIFTSGSTGQPKGCIIEHQSYCSAAINHGSVLGMSKYTRALQFGSYSFAGAIMETLMALIYGGCVCILSEDQRGAGLTSAIRRLDANWAFLTSTTLANLNPDDVPSLRTICIGGEPIRRAQILEWAPKLQLRQTYGSAETSAVVSSAHLEPSSEPTFVGKATTSRYWIVDPTDSNQLMPVGAPGEVIIEGPTIGRKYLGEASKSLAAFIAPPSWRSQFGPVDPTCRFYKTGDMASFRHDGSISLLGRKDTQVKLRGQRIEVEEVEQQARQASKEVAEIAVVLATLQADGAESQELVAFLVAQTGVAAERHAVAEVQQHSSQTKAIAQSIQARLESVLPYYMVPSLIVPISSLPRTVSGKMDRRVLRQIAAALPPSDIEKMRYDMQGEKRSPRTEKERKIRDLWSLVLDVEAETIGLDDSFFRLGGDSIAAMKVVGEARKIGLELAVADLFRLPILHQLASQARRPTENSSAVIPRAQTTGPVEQSYAQGRLWFMDQLHPGLSWYLMPFAMGIRGPLRKDALQAALHALESRHETLRTTFMTRDGVSYQTVLPFQPKKLTVVDVTGGDQNHLTEALQIDHTTVFDMENEAGWRATLFKIDPEHNVLSIVMHHIISDGWSMDVLRRELAIFYSAAINNRDPLSCVEPLSIQYRDFSVWQKQQEPEHMKQLEYWTKHLETSQPAELPCDKPRPATLSGLAEMEEVEITGAVLDQAAHYAMTMADDATIGTPNANRDQWQLNDIIGFFVNPQCMRIKIGAEETFESLVRQVQKSSTASFENQDVPFERIVSSLNAGRDLSRHPLIQMVFAVHSQPDLGNFTLEGLDVSLIPMLETSRFDLELHFFQQRKALRGQLVYSTDLYEGETIRAFLSVFTNILQRGLSEPQTQVALLPQCSNNDYAKLKNLGLLDVVKADYPRDKSTPEVFRDTAAKCQSNVAVKDSFRQLTYFQLDEESNLVARFLKRRDLAPESMVCVFANRSCDAIVAFLGILKAGHAYVPLDVKAPAARIRQIMTSLPGKRLVLVAHNVAFPDLDLGDVELVVIKEAAQLFPSEQTQDASQVILPGPNSLAYVVFTSGSTGKPKGVMIEHRGVVRLAKQTIYSNAGAFSHLLNIAFDAAAAEIYPAILNGGTLVCIDSATVLDYNALADTFSREEIRVAAFTPPLLKQCLTEQRNAIERLDVLFIGGDRLDPQDIMKTRRLMQGDIINAYGPTENTCTSTSYTFQDGERCTNGVPIGRAIHHSGAFVMNAEQTLVPIGVVGELVVTGDGVARGYLDSRHDQGRFVHLNLGGSSVRAYRTGDHVRWRPVDGELEFLGRIDGQVKIRGHRIELGEIEQALRSHTVVNDAAVVLRAHEDRGPELFGFVTLRETDRVTADENSDNMHQLEHVDQWHGIFESSYNEVGEIRPEMVGRDFIGWTSMYDQSKISDVEMNEWLDDTIRTILNGGDAGNILEIGTGTGQILFNLTTGLRSYHGLEPSETAVGFVMRAAKALPAFAEKVHVRQGTAADIDRLQSIATPDTVIINSVAQYFPSRDYLFKVVQDILQLSGVKTIFFGDMRSFALYKEFRAKKSFYALGPSPTKEEVLREMEAIEKMEPELLVDPAYFTSLVDMLPDQVAHVEILPKVMKATNELSSYRYAAVIHAKQRQGDVKVYNVVPDSWINFEKQGLARETLSELLIQSPSPTVAVENIPHSKTIVERCIVESLDDPLNHHDWISVANTEASSRNTLYAMDLMEMGQAAGYRVELSWARQHSQHGGLDAIFHRLNRPSSDTRVMFKFPTDHEGRLNSMLCSQPLKQRLADRLPAEIRDWLQSQIPSYMVPRIISVIEKMPVNANGKLDRKALLHTIPEVTVPVGDKKQPSSEMEKQLQDIWSQVLVINAEMIGVEDNFFQLGGDSISAMKVVSRAHKLGIKLAIADIFNRPTITEQAQLAISGTTTAIADPDPFTLLPGSFDEGEVRAELATRFGLDASEIEDVYPCTALQQGLLSLTTQKSSDYVMQMALEVAPEIDLGCFKGAWEQVVESLTILRTRIVQHDDFGLIQVVCNEGIQWKEASNLDDYVRTDSELPFGLGDRLSRFAIISKQGESNTFVWTIHHALYDGWTLPIILDLVRTAYEGRRPLARPKFSSFIRHLAGLKEEDEKRFWQTELGDAEYSTYPTLPPSVRDANADASMDYILSGTLESTKQVTLSTLARAAMGILLSQFSGSLEVAFGAVLSGRNAGVPGIDDIVGPTLATVPIAIQAHREQTVANYLHLIQAQAMRMMEFEQTGLQRIAAFDESCRTACGFQTLLVVQPTEDEMDNQDMLGTWSSPGTSGTDVVGNSTYAITFQCFLNGQNKKIKASYDPRVVSSWAMRGMLEQFGNLLDVLARADESCSLGDLCSLSQRDTNTISQWNAHVPSRIESCLHNAISEHARRAPDTPAICAWDGEATYKQLDELSTKLAAQLISHGVGPEVFVPVVFEKSIWAVVAMLAVLKAGGAFVPLDPESAPDRRQKILQRVGARIVLTSAASQDISLPAACTRLVVCRDTFSPTSGSYPVRQGEATPRSAAYIIFTSGSTGEPKGVVMEHSSALTSCINHGAAFGFSPSTRMLQAASYTFDLAVLEVFTVLTSGACVCIVSDAQRLDDLVGAMNSMAMNSAFLTPTVARTLEVDRIETLKTIILGAEPVSIRDFETWSPLGTVLNGYGPTEAAMISVTGICSRESMEKGSIGSAVGCATWVVDRWDHNKLAPLGAVGELLLEGHILAREYFDSPGRTAASFIENPPWLVETGITNTRDARLYKTGDLVRYNEDGRLTYIGRKDNQVKIRGQRVELGEVEGHLIQQLPFVHQLAVEVITPSGEGARPVLACFFSANDLPYRTQSLGDGIDLVHINQEMEDALSERLPRYMVPGLYLKLDHIPQTSSEKTNRRQLQAIGSGLSSKKLAELQASLAGNKKAPRTDVEHKLREVWAKVLNIEVDSIGIDDSFLHLGGDSITAMQVSASARSIQIDISTADILKLRTIANLAANVVTLVADAELDLSDALEDIEGVFDLSPIQQLYVQVEPEPGRCFDQGFFLKLRMPSSTLAVQEALHSIISRHPMLRSRFMRSETGVWTQQITSDIAGSMSIQEAVHADTPGQIQALAIRLCREALDIENGPLLSATVFLDGERQVQNLYLSVHHLVIDLISWRVLLQELEEILERGEASLSPTVGFKTWTRLQAQYLAKKEPDAISISVQQPMTSYWGIESNHNTQGKTRSTNFSLDSETSALLFGKCNDAFGTRPIELMVAALGFAFQEVFTDRPVPAIYSEGHGREPWDSRIDLSRTIGWFTTIWPAQAGGSSIGSDLIDSIRRTKDFMRALKKNGWQHFSSKFATEEDARQSSREFPLEVLFNYIGSFQQLERSDSGFQVIEAPAGCEPRSAADLHRFSIFDVGAQMERGRLIVYFSYPENARHQDKIMDWVCQYKLSLEQIGKALQGHPPSWTLSDFPGSFSSYSDLITFQQTVQQVPAVESLSHIEDIFPCSPMQEGLLVGQGKDSNNYRTVLSIEVVAKEGEVSVSRIKDAWRAVVRHHTLLRALVIDDVPGSSRPMLVILQDPLPGVTVTDKAFEGPNGLTNVDNSLSATYGSQGLQHHLTIHKANEQRAELQLHINHLLCDGFSIHVLLDDFRKAYNGDLGASGPLYRRYIEYIQEQPHDEGLDFWTHHLQGIEPTFFPASQEDPVQETFYLQVPDIDAERIHKFCANREVTTASIIQTAWGLVLQAYTGATNPCFGTMTSGRDAPIEGVNQMMAPLICIIPCYIQFSQHRSVIDTLKTVQDNFVTSLPYQTFPLMEIQHAFSAGAAGLFNSIISFQKGVVQKPKHDEGDVIRYTNGQDQAEYDVSINASDTSKDLVLTFLFRHGFMSMPEANRLVRAFSLAIDSLIRLPDGDTAQISLVSESDKKQLWAWNGRLPHVMETCVHDIIGERIKERPSKIALCSDEGEITYGELDQVSNHLAHHLSSYGVGPEFVVPLCFEKSIWTIVAILGVLRAGAAFVLLEPGLPDERMRKICSQVQCSIAVSSVSCRHRLSAFVADTIVLGRDLFQSTKYDTSLPLRKAGPDNAAYIIFTSGSTGEPKGCIIDHRSYCSTVPAQAKMSNMSSAMRTIQFGSYNFAGSIYEILMTLMHGGCICVPSEEERGTQLAQFIQKYDVNWTFITATVLALLKPEQVPSLKTICVGGEPVRGSQVKQWASKVALRQTYGSAETAAVISTGWLDEESSVTDVGQPQSARLWIVSPSDHNKLVPIGVPGELIVEGPMVGRCYVGQPEKTAMAFVSAPSWREAFGPSEKTSRFYKAGDLAIYKSSGAIQLLGRKDTQIKLRGQRIEVGEIEYQARLATADVKDVAVELLKIGGNTSKGPELVGFIVVHGDSDQMIKKGEDNKTLVFGRKTCTVIGTVQERLESTLPHYMVPAYLLPISALPQTVTGKTDRLRLRKMGADISLDEVARLQAALAGEKRQPQTEAERTLRALWAQVLELDVDNIGVNDSFFRKGGDSIAAMRLVGAARKAGMTVAIADIFRNPTLTAQAAALQNAGASPDVSILRHEAFSLLPATMKDEVVRSAESLVAPATIADIYPLTAFQEDNIKYSVSSPTTCLNYVFLDFEHAVDEARLAQSCSSLLSHIAMLRSVFVEAEGQYWQVILESAAVALQTYNTDESVEAASTQICSADPNGGFSLGSTPTRFMLVKNQMGVSRLIIRLSHAQYDGVSMPIILQSLLDLYQGKLLSPSVDFSVFLSHRQSKQETSSAYWKHLLHGFSITNLPSSLDTVSQKMVENRVAARRIEVESTFELPKLPENITLSSLIGAAWGIVISALTGQDDVIYGSLVAGRNASIPNIEDVLGPCVNVIPVRARVTGDATTQDLITSIQDQHHFVGEADSMGLSDIIKTQPTWPADSKFSSVIQHQNVEERPQLEVEGGRVTIDWFENPDYVPPDISMISYPEEDKFRAKIMANSHIMSSETAHDMLRCLNTAVVGLAQSPQGTLSSTLTEAGDIIPNLRGVIDKCYS
ncbi:hypothetical protein B0I35DRAFT_477044 [Stachybotrys elegans]|uniref:Carrier domain-containing protein n=1 Tax=Stachybotrys elegans TaxID=80388 RepID=A0A8K0SXZ9_9HYPO|nr:hypothetical protein B0I35DRAFT_477044 [Stachybotrys elegans]